MKIRHITPLALIAVIVGVLFAFGGSQTSSGGSQTSSAQDLEEFRGRLATYFADLEEAYPNVVAAGGPSELLEQVAEARQLIPGLSAEELWVSRDAFSQYPALWDLPTTISLAFDPAAQVGAAQGSTGSTGSLMSHSCPAPGPGGAFAGPQKHIENYFALEGLALLADAALEALPQDTLAAIPRVAAAALWALAQTPALVQLGLNEVNDVCEQDNHRAILHDVVGPRVDVAVSSRASQTSLNTHDTNIDGDLVAHNTNIDGDLVAHNTNIDGDLVAHNTNIDGDLVAHNTNIDGDLVAHDGNLATHDVDIKALVGGVQQTLDTTTEKMRVHLQVMTLPGQGEFLITADEAGLPVDVEFIAVQYSRDNLISFVDVLADTTVTVVKPGIHHLVISAKTSAAQIWEFQVRDDHGSYTHFGITVFNQSQQNSTGQ